MAGNKQRAHDKTAEPNKIDAKKELIKEARKWLVIGKTNVGESRNLRADLKKGILEALNKLYSIIKLGMGEEIRSEEAEEEVVTPKTTQNMEEQLQAHSALLLEHITEVRGIKRALEERHSRAREAEQSIWKQLEDLTEVTRKTGETYAELKNRISVPLTVDKSPCSIDNTETIPRPSYAVIVTSNTIEDSELTNKVRSALDAKNQGIQIQKVRRIKDDRIVVRCNKKEEIEKTITQLKKDKNLQIEETQNKNPLVVLKNILSHNTDSDILIALRNQNANLFRDLSEEESAATVRYRRRARNPQESHVILQVSPKLWQRITEAGRVYVDLQSVRAQDQTPLVQCSRCLAYGHGKRLCVEEQDLCHHCGKPHLRAECPDKAAGIKQSCVNCRRAKGDDDAHSTYSDLCPVRKKWDALSRITTAYC